MSMLLDAMKRDLYRDVVVGPALSNTEARARGLSIDNPVELRLEELYTKYVDEDPEALALSLWTAQTVGVPKWIQKHTHL